MSTQTTSGHEPSKGTQWSIWAALIVVIAFFLPWVRACGTDLSGLELATNKMGNVQDAWVFWATLLAGLVCLALAFLSRPEKRGEKVRNAYIRLFAAAIGATPLFTILLNALQRRGVFELLYGWWLTVAGIVGLLVSAMLDLFQPPDTVDEVKIDFSQKDGGEGDE